MPKFQEIQFSAGDVVNGDDWIALGESNPHSVRPYLMHDHGVTLAVVFADNLQDAMDIAADAEKLDRYKVTEAERPDYDGKEDQLAYLGNYCVAHDIESLGVVELPNVRRRGYAEAFELTFPSK